MGQLGTLGKTSANQAASEDRATEVLLAAADLFYRQGFDATSMNDIAEAVNLTKAGLYYYTKGKGDLLVKIMNYAMDRVERDIIVPCQAIEDAEQRLTQIIRRHLDAIIVTGGAITILTGEVDKLTATQNAAMLDRKRLYLDLVRNTLAQLKKQKRLRDLDVTIASLNMFSTILGVARWHQPQGRFAPKRVTDETLRFILSALLKDPAQS
jgi:AcrR family transcriptional regulator